MIQDKLKAAGKGIVYIGVLLILLFLLLLSTFAFMLMLGPGEATWMRVTCGCIGGMCATLNTVLVFVVNRFIAIRMALRTFGSVLFWTGCLLVSVHVITAISAFTALAAGFELPRFEGSGGGGWDWD
ncbi:MAG: hypothetical protein JNM43_00115 [Planctomycetaceae bacterium]|nr:hypothetical protein [Planctomycetaceae bacterium]